MLVSGSVIDLALIFDGGGAPRIYPGSKDASTPTTIGPLSPLSISSVPASSTPPVRATESHLALGRS